jgi:prevent-host-death family protein
MVTTLSSRIFNQDASGAKKAANNGPVFITDRGRPAHVLLTIEDYQKLCRTSLSLADAIAQPDGGEIDFEAPRFGDGSFAPAALD